jgi:hypothetical protein
MRAGTGDWIVIKGHLSGQPERRCEVVEARGPGGAPPYVVHWTDSEHETLFFPGADASVVHPAHAKRRQH